MKARRFVAALVVVAMMSGCATYRASKYSTIAGVAVAVVGVVGLGRLDCPFSYDTGEGGCLGKELAYFGAAAIGAAVALGGLVGMAVFPSDRQVRAEAAAQERAAVAPSEVDERFWCQRDTGICTNDQGTCGSDCLSAKSVWCAPYKTVDGVPGLLCGLSDEVCAVLVSSDHNRRGRESFGECAQRTELLPPAPPVTPPGATP